ncbi:MAG: prepilin peptidase [Planctomycetota bacterium]
MSWQLYQILGAVVWLGFAFAFGACVGSLLNVLVYRLPRGLDVVSPPSRCPLCNTRLTWRENVPVFGWLSLGGKCRFCRSPISAEYPLIEALVGLMFVALFAWWYLVPSGPSWLGVDWGWGARPWTEAGFGRTWPMYVMMVTLLSCLLAATLIDARTFMIPALVVNVPTAVGVVGHTAYAAWIGHAHGGFRWFAEGWTWTIPTPGVSGWVPAGVAAGGVAGLVVSWALARLGLLKRSFADYDEWEAKALQEARDASGDGSKDDAEALSADDSAEMWVQYPHARREMVRELLYVGPAVVLGMLGVMLGRWLGAPWSMDPLTGDLISAQALPLWAQALTGSVLGYLIGGGVVWLMRIAGSLAFGKEALGLGDVHLMAAVGACLGWIDPVVAFFVAAFVGVAVEVVRGLLFREVKRTMPYGPYLAIATVLVIVFKPWVEWGLGGLLRFGGALPLP